MNRLSEHKLVLVTRKTRLEELVTRYTTVDQARFHIEHGSGDFGDYLSEHDTYQTVLHEVEGVLTRLGRVQRVDRGFLPNFLFGPDDIVIVVGQDGLVANTLKYLRGQPTLAINPDPQRYEGVLLPFTAKDVNPVTREVLRKSRPTRSITLAEALLNDGQRLLAVNDLFIGQRAHASARYTLRVGNANERQSSSGIIVSTGLGSTGWMRSIIAGSQGVLAALGRGPSEPLNARLDWDAPSLRFAVREPWPSVNSGASLVYGDVSEHAPLAIESEMPENGVIFSDGQLEDCLIFNSGSRVTVRVADVKGQLVI